MPAEPPVPPSVAAMLLPPPVSVDVVVLSAVAVVAPPASLLASPASVEPPRPPPEPMDEGPPLPVGEPSESLVDFPQATATSIDETTRHALRNNINSSSNGTYVRLAIRFPCPRGEVTQ